MGAPTGQAQPRSQGNLPPRSMPRPRPSPQRPRPSQLRTQQPRPVFQAPSPRGANPRQPGGGARGPYNMARPTPPPYPKNMGGAATTASAQMRQPMMSPSRRTQFNPAPKPVAAAPAPAPRPAPQPAPAPAPAPANPYATAPTNGGFAGGAPMPGQGAPAYGMYGGAGVQQPQQPVQSAAPEKKKKAGPKYSDLAKRSVKEQAPVDPQQLASVANTVRQCIDAGVLRLQQSGKLGIRANQRQMESCKKRLQVLYQKL